MRFVPAIRDVLLFVVGLVVFVHFMMDQPQPVRAPFYEMWPAIPIAPPGTSGTRVILAPSPVDLQAVLEAQLNALPNGSYGFHVPSPLKVGVKGIASLNLAQEVSNRVTDELKRMGMSEIGTVKAGPLMRATLNTDEDGIRIRSLGPSDRPLMHGQFTNWSWELSPLEGGDYELELVVSARLRLPEGSQEPADVRVLKKSVHVQVNPPYSIWRFIRANAAALITFQLLWTVLWALGKRVVRWYRDKKTPRIVLPKPTDY